MNTIKNLVLMIATMFSVACAGVQTQTNMQTQELIRLRAELQVCRDTGKCAPAGQASATASATTTAETTPANAQRTANTGRQALGPMPSPGLMAVSGGFGTPYATSPAMVYRGGTGDDNIALGVAVLDTSRDTGPGIYRFSMGVNPLTLMQQRANAVSIEINEIPVPISAYGQRVPQALGEYRMADGIVKTRPIFVAPMFQSFQEGLRVHFDSTRAYRAKICFHMLQQGRGTYQILECRLITIEGGSGSKQVAIEMGTWVKS